MSLLCWFLKSACFVVVVVVVVVVVGFFCFLLMLLGCKLQHTFSDVTTAQSSTII